MKYQKKIFTVLTFLFLLNCNAQEFKLGKVSLAELEEKEHPKDPSAAAAILWEKGEVRFEYSQDKGFEMLTEIQARIKIYKKEGYEWANKKVSYYIESQLRERVDFSDAISYNLVDGKIEKTKLKSDGEFDEKINKYWSQMKITMPNVKEGSIIEYKYTIRSPRIGSMRDWDFQTSIPVNYSEFSTSVPEYFVFKPNQKGFIFPKVTVLKKRNSIVLINKERTTAAGFSATTTSFSQEKVEFEEIRSTYISKDLPAMKDEIYVNNIDNYTSSISHELSLTKYPNQPLKYYSTDWESVVKTIYDYDDFGPELNKTGYFEEDVKKILTGLSTQSEKIAAIFNYVKSAVKWNNFTGYTCDEGVRKAYKNKSGNIAEINLMLTVMLRFAELEANPVLVSTRDNGIAFYPSRSAFNCVIAAVETPEGLILLDASEKYSQPNILPFRDLNWIGRLIRKDGTSTEVDLIPKTTSIIAVNMNVELKKEGVLDGKIRSYLMKHSALDFRNANLGTSTDSYLEKLEKRNNNIEIKDYTRENEVDLEKPVVEIFTFKDLKSVEIIDSKMYILPLLFLAQKENPFKQEVREYPVDFGYPTQEKYSISILIPEGYAVETLPASLNLATGDNVGSFKFISANPGNVIQISVTKEIKLPIVSADFYPVLKGFYQQLTDKQNEKIVLKKL